MAKDDKKDDKNANDAPNVTTQAAEAATSGDRSQVSATENRKAFAEQWAYLAENGRLPSGYGRSGAFIFKVQG